MNVRELETNVSALIRALEEIRGIAENNPDSADACDEIWKIADEVLWPV